MPQSFPEDQASVTRAATGPWQLASFRAFACMRFCWGFAQEIITVGLGWLIYDRTHSVLALGMVGLSSFLPSILLSLVTGVTADRLDRRLIMVAASVTVAVCALALCVLSTAPVGVTLYAVVVLQGIARAFAQPASKAMVPNLGPPHMLSRIIAAATTVQLGATIVGPAIGGVLIALGNWVPFAVASALASLAAIAAGVLGVQRAAGSVRGRPDLAAMLAGFRFIGSRPAVLGAMSLDFLTVLFASANALLPFYVSEVFHEGPWALGALRMTEALGALTTAVLLSHFPIHRNIGPRLLIACGIYGIANAGFGLSTGLYAGMAWLLVVGASDTVSMVTRNAMIQMQTPDAMQGRVAAVHSVTTGASNDLGEFESGVLAHFIGGMPAVVAGGVLALTVALSWLWLFPSVRRTDQLEMRRS